MTMLSLALQDVLFVKYGLDKEDLNDSTQKL